MAVSRVLQLILASLVCVRAVYRVEIQLDSYDNIQGGRCAGCGSQTGCCDRHDRTSCTGGRPCDNYFTFCIREQDAPFMAQINDETCLLNTPLTTNTSATVFDDDHLTFGVGETALNGLPNPLVFIFDSNWTQTRDGFQFHVQVSDYDPDMASDDFVDSFNVNHAFTVRQQSGRAQGQFGFGEIQGTIQVLCADNYFGGNCSTFCNVSEEESDRYICDQNGTKVCQEGLSCETDPCISSPCPDGASCIVLPDAEYECVCANGYIFDGDRCANECTPGFTGRNCDIDMDMCHNTRPCENGATCVSIAPDGYQCLCVDGYNGINCEMQNKCIPNPCQNGGTCNNVANNYSCACGPDSTGQLCDQEVVLGERGGDESNLVIAIVGGAIAAVVVVAIPIVIVILVIVLLLMKQKRGSSDFGNTKSLPVFRECDNPAYGVNPTTTAEEHSHNDTAEFDNPLYTSAAEARENNNHLYAVLDQETGVYEYPSEVPYNNESRASDYEVPIQYRH